MEPSFDHESLDAYRAAVEFAAWAGEVIEKLPAKLSARDQLDRASTSAVLNIAEGNGKFSLRDRRRYFEIALGSELECAGCIDILVGRKYRTLAEARVGKTKLQRAVSPLIGLIRSLERRIGESESPVYEVDPPI
jgi:four helix bundle protein